MKCTGIIAEYNPFHNGHLYQISQAKHTTRTDYLIIAMSGNFTQRGTPAIVDKYTRAQMALINGADLVLEIPPLFASASAEFFAMAGVSLFDHCGIISSLSFGCETPEIKQLLTLSKLLTKENEAYSSLLQTFLREGNSYPLARSKALQKTNSLTAEDSDIYEQLLSSSNNILALEYLKAIHIRKSSIEAFPIKREGNQYNQDVLSGTFSSATAIRKNIFTKKEDFMNAVPKNVISLLKAYEAEYCFMEEDLFSQMLMHQLLINQLSGYESFMDCNLDLSNRIRRNLNSFTSFHDFCDILKSKDVTYTRIQRMLLHILLNQTQADFAEAKCLDYSPYIKVLGFKKSSSALLSHLKKHADVPIITKPSAAQKVLDEPAYTFYMKNLFADQIYYSCQSIQCKKYVKHEFERSPIIIE